MLSALLTSALTFLRESFSENLGLKALALAFALGLFAFLQGQTDEQQRTIPVPIVMRLPPESAERELMTPIPASIHVTLRGPARAIDRLIQTGVVPIEIDLREGRRESISFEPKNFSFPPETAITIIDPPSIDLEWEDVVTRQIPMQAAITGQPADGYVVKGEPDVDPTQLTVRGPVSVVEVMQFARLAAFDVSGLSEGIHRRRISIDAPPVRARYIGPSAANVAVTIARRVSEAKFENRPVEVVGVPGAGTVPRTVDVTVTGPPEIVRALRPEQIIARADLSKAPNVDLKKHGSAVVKVTVELGHADSELQPPSVTVKW
ncbi:MAG TPA: CdaR family protein [Polyangiaceae bacterium]|jgi:YbbR domain-containing protein|nr:CdaR family protein [Polyangiaceae bacterium]